MSISSMTGFARSEGQVGAYRWAWEARSVNGKGLDIRLRLTAGMESLEPKVRVVVAKRFRRGNVSVTLQTVHSDVAPKVQINRQLLGEIAAIIEDVSSVIPTEPPRIDGLLGIRGVLEVSEPEESAEERAAREEAILLGLDQALDELAEVRDEEGGRICTVLDAHLDEISALVAQASDCARIQPEALKARLREQVNALLDASPALSEDRLVQEVALLATKADVREELDRLRAHVEAARALLAEDRSEGGVGRRLDFLCQEFNRETNTLCSKSVDIELTRIGLELKAVIDRFREQVQNIE